MFEAADVTNLSSTSCWIFPHSATSWIPHSHDSHQIPSEKSTCHVPQNLHWKIVILISEKSLLNRIYYWLVVFRHPSEKYEFVNWDDEIPKISGKIKVMATKPPTSCWIVPQSTFPSRLNAEEDLRIAGHAVCGDHKGQLALREIWAEFCQILRKNHGFQRNVHDLV